MPVLDTGIHVDGRIKSGNDGKEAYTSGPYIPTGTLEPVTSYSPWKRAAGTLSQFTIVDKK